MVDNPSAIDRIPTNPNFLSPLGFKFSVKKLPHVVYFVQTVAMPGFNITPTSHPTPFTKIPYSGEHIQYNPLRVTFKVDEDMQNYLELHNWMRGLGFPEDFTEYRDLAANPSYTGEGLVSDLSLIVLTSLKNPNLEVTFRDAFPISLDGFEFNSVEEDVIFINCTVEFVYTLFEVSILP